MPVDILDHTRDLSGRETHRLTSLYPPPAYVKTASHERLCGDPETLPAHIYADPTHKLYPCHSAPATWMSATYFYDKRASHDPGKADLIEKRILEAAIHFGIGGDVTELRKKIAANVGDELTKLADDDFALIWHFENGTKERHWPLRNAREVQFAADHFAKHRDKFAFDDRHKIAVRILEKALSFGAHLGGHDDVLEKSAGNGGCSARTAAEMCESRAKMVKAAYPEYSEELLKMAGIIRSAPAQARGHDKLLKLAGMIDLFDRATNLNKLYDAGGLPRPEEVLFQVTEKEARAFVDAKVQTTTGNVYAIADFEKVSVDKVREWMGDEFTDAVAAGGLYVDGSKVATIVPTLDRGAATSLDRMMEAASLAPVMRDKAASAGISRDQLFSLAAKYQPGQIVRGSVL
jgi:hypothetical protein